MKTKIWNLEGLRIQATYLGTFKVSGLVKLSRVAYGGRVKHHVMLDEPCEVYGSVRESLMIEHKEIDAITTA